MGQEMSPVELQVLLWIFSRPEPLPEIVCPTQGLSKILNGFLEDDLIEYPPEWPHEGNPECTPRGVAFLEHVLNLPLPEQKWVVRWVLPGVDTRVDT